MSVNKNKGFTLLEAMIAITVMAILAAIAIPAMQSAQAGSRIRSATNDLSSALADARAKAIGLQRSLVLSAIGDDWSNGWTLARETKIDADEPDLAAHRGVPASVVLTTDPDLDALVFLPNGMVTQEDGTAVVTLRFQVCDSNVDTETGRDVWLTRLGRTGARAHADASVCN